MSRINVTKTFLPPLKDYEAYLKRIWETKQVTNKGPLLREFEETLKDYIGNSNVRFFTNGTLALQIALSSLDIYDGEVITTPFSYVATVSSILWERCTPVFVDINENDFCIDASKVEAAITKNTKAIMPVHVFGNACDVEEIDRIAKENNIRVIYDAAHAFGVKYKGKSLLNYGDVSMCSFHATKLFHTIEGGCLAFRDSSISKKADLISRFGHHDDEHILPGMNAKASEFQAAMGLAVMPHLQKIINGRKKAFMEYSRHLGDSIRLPQIKKDLEYNYSYYPVVFKNEQHLKQVVERLNKNNIYPRRYFYPSLNTLPYLERSSSCPVSEDISSRILCLPMYYGLSVKEVAKICEIIRA